MRRGKDGREFTLCVGRLRLSRFHDRPAPCRRRRTLGKRQGRDLPAMIHPCHVLDRDGGGRIRIFCRPANRLGGHHAALSVSPRSEPCELSTLPTYFYNRINDDLRKHLDGRDITSNLR